MNKEDAEKARKFFAQSCHFVLAAAAPKQFPESPFPEIAFIGRSNVGKSSLINALVGQKALARTSRTPGRTQQIVFFDLSKKLMIVDLPGYGHAKAPIAERDQWNGLVESYLRKRPSLMCVCLLLDSRHEVKANDLEMMKFLDRAAVVYQIVMTKRDQIRPSSKESNVLQQVEELVHKHPAALHEIIMTSARDKSGMDALRAFIWQKLIIGR